MISTYTDTFPVCAIILCFMSLSHSAPLTCEDLVRPLDQLDFHHLEGRRALVAGSLSNPAHLGNFKRRESASINFANETSKTSIKRVFGFGDSCQYLNSNITLEGSGFTFYRYNLTVTVLYTSCPDCLVMRFDESKELLRLYLFSRRRDVEQKEMEEFRTQAECLNMPQPVMMDPTKELCPEQIPEIQLHKLERNRGTKGLINSQQRILSLNQP